jgi:ribokinase
LSVDLEITGHLNWDTSLFVKKLPRAGEEVIVERIDLAPGGKGGNVAVAAARILGPKRVALLACVGQDEVGKKQIALLREEGVDTTTVQLVSGQNSGQAYVIVDEKGRNIIGTHFGANAGLAPEQIMAHPFQTVLASSRMLVAISPPPQIARKLLAEARRLRRLILWHPGVLARYGMDKFERELKELNYLVLNEYEASQFTGAKGLDESLRKMAKLAPKTRILVTLGNKGAIFYSDGEVLQQKQIVVEKLGKKIVNTTGSGDAFVGAFAAYKVMGLNDRDAFRYANLAGALNACRPETRGSPTGKELEKAYKEYFKMSSK